MAKERELSRIHVNALYPGMIGTAFHVTFTKDAVRVNIANATALKREGSANKLVDTVAYLVSSE